MDFSWKEVGGSYEFSNANYIISNYSGILLAGTKCSKAQ